MTEYKHLRLQLESLMESVTSSTFDFTFKADCNLKKLKESLGSDIALRERVCSIVRADMMHRFPKLTGIPIHVYTDIHYNEIRVCANQ